jgi:hypothetical protein
MVVGAERRLGSGAGIRAAYHSIVMLGSGERFSFDLERSQVGSRLLTPAPRSDDLSLEQVSGLPGGSAACERPDPPREAPARHVGRMRRGERRRRAAEQLANSLLLSPRSTRSDKHRILTTKVSLLLRVYARLTTNLGRRAPYPKLLCLLFETTAERLGPVSPSTSPRGFSDDSPARIMAS